MVATGIVVVTLGYIWFGVWLLGPRHWSGGALILGGIAAAIVQHRRRRSDAARWGLSGRAFRPALARATAATAAAIAAIIVAGIWIGRAPGRDRPGWDLVALLLWGTAQQFVLQTVILEELRRRLPRDRAVLAAALTFGALHLPNPLLAPLTFAGAWIWCSIHARFPNILPLALSHALTSLTILAMIPRDVTGRMRVGYSYLLP